MSSLLSAIAVLSVFAFGGTVGLVLRKNPSFMVWIGRLTVWLVYLLLFLLGYSVGEDPVVVRHIGEIGLQALGLAFGAVAGSLALVYFYGKYFLAIEGREFVLSGQTRVKLWKSMMGSLVLLVFFVGGLALGYWGIDNGMIAGRPLAEYALYALMWLVGVGIGGDKNAWSAMKKMRLSLLGIPAAIALGSLVGAWGCSLLQRDVFAHEGMAVGAGMGYYSLSSVFISELAGERLGTIALLANIFREIFTLVATPLLCRLFGPLAGVASAGATAMDTSLPVIMRVAGAEVGSIAVLSGFVLTVLVPVLVPLAFVL
ncbi:MAG: lysine exporter LysO family protein [Breznakibacter sp.]